MSDDDRDEYKVEDAEGYVDRKLKEELLNLRRKIDEREDQILAHTETGELDYDSGIRVFHRTINQFLRRIEPLLRNEQVDGALEAYSETKLGEMAIYPPPVEISTPGQFMEPEELELKRRFEDKNPDINLSINSNIPQPKTKPVVGLKEIINSDGKGAEWEVSVTKLEGESVEFGNRGVQTTISNFEPYDYEILVNAIRVADGFLANADLGLSLTSGEPHGKT